MSSESNLVESMVTKLCIPRTESLEGGDASHTPTPPDVNPQIALRTATVGKRRMCTRADDTYGGQKQRQRLGSAEMDGAKELTADDFSSDGKTKNSPQFPATNAPGGFVHLNSGNWPGSESVAEKAYRFGPSRAVGSDVSSKWVDKSDEATQSRETDVHTGRQYGDECMDVEAKQSGAGSEAKHRWDGAMCRSVDKEAELFKPNGGEELEFRVTFAVGHPGAAGEWRELKVDSIPGNDRIEEVKGVRMFRRYKKIAAKSSSRSDLMNRHSNSSELANISVRNSADLDAFFTEMGMDRSAIASALNDSHLDHTLSTTSLNIFENISSIGTPLDSRSCTSRDSQPTDDALLGKSLDLDDHVGPGMSIVERNARVIRWLCNIRKASTMTDDGEV